MLALMGGAGVVLRPWMDRWLPMLGALALLLWLLAMVLCVLLYRFNRHNAACYSAAARQVEQRWWARHQQRAALVEMVLIGPACSLPEHRRDLFKAESKPPQARDGDGGKVLRSSQVLAKGQVERERQLAKLLVFQLQAQLAEPLVDPLLRCYWQGSTDAWRTFAAAMDEHFGITLPECPEPWRGHDSLERAIDELQEVDEHGLILCAGCESLPGGKDNGTPAGEAALLWLLGKAGGVKIARGEAFVEHDDAWPEVAQRALQQSGLEQPVNTCASFSPAPAECDWNLLQPAPVINFGELQQLEAMVALSLAAAHVQLNAKPCAWLASDPSCTLALGVVTPDETTD